MWLGLIWPNDHPREELSLEELKDFLASRGVVFGLVDDKEKNDELDVRVRTLMDQEDKAGSQLTGVEKRIPLMMAHIEKIKGQMEALGLPGDRPGIPVIKVYGRIFDKTKIFGPHKELSLPDDRQKVRIAASKVEESGNRYQMKISSLR